MIKKTFIDKSKKSIVSFIWRIDSYPKPTEDPDVPVYFRYYDTEFPKTRRYADFKYTQLRHFIKFTTSNIIYVNVNEDTDISSEGVVRPVGVGSDMHAFIHPSIYELQNLSAFRPQ